MQSTHFSPMLHLRLGRPQHEQGHCEGIHHMKRSSHLGRRRRGGGLLLGFDPRASAVNDTGRLKGRQRVRWRAAGCTLQWRHSAAATGSAAAALLICWRWLRAEARLRPPWQPPRCLWLQPLRHCALCCQLRSALFFLPQLRLHLVRWHRHIEVDPLPLPPGADARVGARCQPLRRRRLTAMAHGEAHCRSRHLRTSLGASTINVHRLRLQVWQSRRRGSRRPGPWRLSRGRRPRPRPRSA